MIDIYRTVNVSSGGKLLYLAVDHATKRYSKPTSALPTEFYYSNFRTSLAGTWTHLGQVLSLPVDTSLYPELLI